MSDYDFSVLSPIDFETLSQDLLQKNLNLTLESFKSGRDQGIDLRYSTVANNNEIIIQCKHYTKTGFNKLKSDLEKKELEKIKTLNPVRYILVTSVEMNPSEKEKILEALHPYILKTGDIFAKDDLNGLLRQYPTIEKTHFKLWLSSTTVLERILHNTIYTQSQFEIDLISDKRKKYVQNESFNKALDILEKYNTCIVSGLPGIGKTTLAEMLTYYYLANNYDLISVTTFNQALDVFNSERKQIFYYDDFLGQTALQDKLDKNEDQSIIKFIKRLSNLKNKKFILTTREYILKQAKTVYEKLNSEEVDLRKIIIDLESYTNYIKAEILYNHLYFSDLPSEYIQEIIKSQFYSKVINHRNYKPRIIEWITKKEIIENIKPENYLDYITKSLDNPSKIWQDAFENQISDFSRNLLIVRVSMPEYVYLNDLKKAFYEYYNLDTPSPKDENEFNKSIKELDGTFIETFESQDKIIVTFHNPSIKDFLSSYIVENNNYFQLLLANFLYYEQLSFISLYNEIDFLNYIEDNFEVIINKIIADKKCKVNKYYDNNTNNEYYRYENRSFEKMIWFFLSLLELNIELIKKSFSKFEKYLLNRLDCHIETILIFGENIEEDNIEMEYLLNLMELLNKYKIIDEKSKLFSLAVSYCFNGLEHIEDYEILVSFHKKFPEYCTQEVTNKAKELFDDFSNSTYWSDDEIGLIEHHIEILKELEKNFDIDVESKIDELNEKKYELELEEQEKDSNINDNKKNEHLSNISKNQVIDEGKKIDDLFENLADNI